MRYFINIGEIFMKKKLLLFGAMIFASMGNLFAADEEMPWEDGLNVFLDALTGPTTVIIGSILIVGAGIAIAVTEGQGMKKLFWLVIGIAISLNAPNMLDLLFGNTSGFIF
jgi:type IV secretory pathway VirB2 component (pilin)